jgi:hypothetical protein
MHIGDYTIHGHVMFIDVAQYMHVMSLRLIRT